MKTTKRAAINTRYSSDNQRHESTTGQIRVCEAYCASKGYTVVRIYSDEAKTGTQLAGRDEFQRMIRDSIKDIFDVVVFYQIDRAARNETDYYASMDCLLKNGVSYEFAAEGIDIATPGGKLTEGIKVSVAAWYSRDLSIKVKRGKKENAFQAIHNGGKPPIGYDVEEKTLRYLINEHEAAAVRQIFAMKLAGAGYGQIIDWLNARDYRTKRGNRYAKNSLHDILKNKKYIGTYEYGKTTGNTSREHNKDYIALENAIPPIISFKDFEEVQKIMDSRQNGKNSSKEIYALSGKIFCSCGSAMVGGRSGAKDNKYAYYICSDAKNKHICDAKNVRKEVIEECVRDAVLANLRADREEILNSFSPSSNNAQIEGHKKELQKLVDKKTKAAKQMLDRLGDDNDDIIFSQYDEIKSEINTLKNDIKVLDASYDSDIKLEDVENFLDDILDNPNQMEPKFMKKLFSALVERVTVDGDNVDIQVVYRVSPFVVAPRWTCLKAKLSPIYNRIDLRYRA